MELHLELVAETSERLVSNLTIGLVEIGEDREEMVDTWFVQK